MGVGGGLPEGQVLREAEGPPPPSSMGNWRALSLEEFSPAGRSPPKAPPPTATASGDVQTGTASALLGEAIS